MLFEFLILFVDLSVCLLSGAELRSDSCLFILCIYAALGNFTSQDFAVLLCSFCADSSSPQISAMIVGQGRIIGNRIPHVRSIHVKRERRIIARPSTPENSTERRNNFTQWGRRQHPKAKEVSPTREVSLFAWMIASPAKLRDEQVPARSREG